MKNLIVASTSTIFGGTYLSYLLDELSIHFKETNEIIFIPYARPGGISYDQYTSIAADAFSEIEKKLSVYIPSKIQRQPSKMQKAYL